MNRDDMVKEELRRFASCRFLRVAIPGTTRMYIIYEKDSWDEAGLVLSGNESGALDTYRSNDVEVAVLGYPYDRERIAWLRARELHDSYIQHGKPPVDDLEGSFAILILDRSAHRSFVVIDPYKIFTLFHAVLSGGRLIVSDSVAEIVPHLEYVNVERTAALEFFCFGFVLGDKTIVDGIEAFGPGRVYTIGRGLKIGSERYWNFLDGTGADAAPDELIDAFNAHVENGLSLSERISMPLTGGLDSRTVLSACMEEKDVLHCYTHGLGASDDVEIARSIARRFGISYDYYEIGDDLIGNIPSIARSISPRCDGFLNTVTSAHFINSYERESEHGDLFFSGIGGELMRSYYLPPGSERIETQSAFASAIRRKIQLGTDLSVFRVLGAEGARDRLDLSVQEQLSRYGTDDRGALAESFYLENRIGNFLSTSMRLLGGYFKTFNPFLERDMLQLIPGMPSDDKAGGRLLKRIIVNNSPDLAGILMDRARIIDSSNKRAMAKHLCARPIVLSKIYANKLTGRRLFNFAFTDYDGWLKRYHRDFVLETLDYDKMLLNDLFDRDRLRDLKARFLDTRSDLLGFVTNIMSAEIFMRSLNGV